MTNDGKDDQFCQIVEDQIDRAVQQLLSFTKDINLDAIPNSSDDNKIMLCGLVSPLTIFQILQEVRICYEIYLHIQAQELHRQIIIFPQLCSNINSGKLFHSRLSYPVFNTFLVEKPTCVSCNENRLFLTPQQSSLLSFTAINNDLINPKSMKNIPSSSLSLEILAHNYFDCKRAMNIVKNFHPMQYLATLLVQNPEIFILLGQKIPSQTQRIGFFFGYIQYVQSLFAEDPKISDENTDVKLDVKQLLPPSSLILTPFSRAVSCLLFKSLFEHNQTFENWPESYAYLPVHNANCYLQDFLISVAGCIDVKVWVQNTFYKQIQNLYNEKAINYFDNSVRENSKIQSKICILIENYVKDLVINVKFLPDICKTVLSVAKVCLNNFVYNAVSSMFSQDEELKQRIMLQYPEIIDIIEESDRNLSQQRADLFANKLYLQFFGLFVGQCILQTAFGNPVSYGLIQPQQAYLEENQNFYSNLSFIADLICVAMNPKRNPIVFQLSDEVLSSERLVNFMSKNVKQFLFKKGLESAIYYREQIVEKLFSQIQLQVTPFLYALRDEDYIYPLDTAGVSRIFSASECQISETSVTHGYWVTISSYILFCYNLFQQNVDYLKETITKANKFYPQFLVTFYDATSWQAQDQQQCQTTKQEYQFSCYNQLENLVSSVQEQYRSEKLIEMFITELRIGNQQYQKVSVIPVDSSGNLCSNYDDADKQSTTYVLNTISGILQNYNSVLNGIAEKDILQSDIVDVTQSFDVFKEYITLLTNSKESLQNAAQLKLELQQQVNYSEKDTHKFYEQIQCKVDELIDDIKQELEEFIHLQDIQQLDQIYLFLQQVSKDIMLFCQQLLNNNIPQPDFDILIDSDHLNQVYQRFSQIKQQYKQNKRQTSFDDMILNYRIMVDNMNSSINGKTVFRAHRTIDKLYGYFSQKKHCFRNKVYQHLFEKQEINDISQQNLQLSPNIQSVCQRVQVHPQKQMLDQNNNNIVDVGKLYDQLLTANEFCRKDQTIVSLQYEQQDISVINKPKNDIDQFLPDHCNYSENFIYQKLAPVEKQDSLRTIEEQKALSQAIDQDLADSQNQTPVHENAQNCTDQRIGKNQNTLDILEDKEKQLCSLDQEADKVDNEGQCSTQQQEEITDIFAKSGQFENQEI